jgi:hypothetical protein
MLACGCWIAFEHLSNHGTISLKRSNIVKLLSVAKGRDIEEGGMAKNSDVAVDMQT